MPVFLRNVRYTWSIKMESKDLYYFNSNQKQNRSRFIYENTYQTIMQIIHTNHLQIYIFQKEKNRIVNKKIYLI